MWRGQETVPYSRNIAGVDYYDIAHQRINQYADPELYKEIVIGVYDLATSDQSFS